jgi:hypothetical protein
MRAALACAVMMAGLAACSTPPDHAGVVADVLVDHDGGVDDLIALSLLMKSPAVRVRAVTICPADSDRDAGCRLGR